MDAWTPDSIVDALLRVWEIGLGGVALVGVLAILWRHGWPWGGRRE